MELIEMLAFGTAGLALIFGAYFLVTWPARIAEAREAARREAAAAERRRKQQARQENARKAGAASAAARRQKAQGKARTAEPEPMPEMATPPITPSEPISAKDAQEHKAASPARRKAARASRETRKPPAPEESRYWLGEYSIPGVSQKSAFEPDLDDEAFFPDLDLLTVEAWEARNPPRFRSRFPD